MNTEKLAELVDVILRVSKNLGGLQDYTNDARINEMLERSRGDLVQVAQKIMKRDLR